MGNSCAGRSRRRMDVAPQQSSLCVFSGPLHNSGGRPAGGGGGWDGGDTRTGWLERGQGPGGEGRGVSERDH